MIGCNPNRWWIALAESNMNIQSWVRSYQWNSGFGTMGFPVEHIAGMRGLDRKSTEAKIEEGGATTGYIFPQKYLGLYPPPEISRTYVITCRQSKHPLPRERESAPFAFSIITQVSIINTSNYISIEICVMLGHVEARGVQHICSSRRRECTPELFTV